MAFLSLAGCNSHPLAVRGAHKDVADSTPDGAIAVIAPDGGGPEVRRDPDTRVPEARDTNPNSDVGIPDVRLDRDTRAPDARDTRGPDARDSGDAWLERWDVGADRYAMPGDAPEVGVAAGFELLSWVQSVGGTPIRVLKRDHYVYLGDWANKGLSSLDPLSDSGSIQTYEVKDPLAPVRLSTLFTSGQEMQDLAIVGRWLFAANDAYGIRLVDIGRPESLQSLDNRERGSLYATSVAATTRAAGEERQDYVFVGYLYGGGLDIHLMPEGGPIPAPLHYSSTALPTRCDVHQILIQGDRAYLLASNGETQMVVEILDLSPLPALPTVLGRLALPMASHGGIGDIRLSGNTLYLSASSYGGASPHSGGLRVINVADATKPTLVGSLDVPSGNIPWKGAGLAVAGNQIIAPTPSGVMIINVSTPASPALEGRLPYPAAFGTCLGGTAVAEADLLYVGAYCEPPNGQGGLAIYRRH